MADRRYSLISLLLSAVIFLLTCSNSTDKRNQGTPPKQRQPASPVAKNKPDSDADVLRSVKSPATANPGAISSKSSAPTFSQIVEAAAVIDTSYAELQMWTQQFLATSKPDNEIENEQCMTVAVIAAASHFLAGDSGQAKTIGQQAYSYTQERSIKFLPGWDSQKWLKARDYQTAKKLAQMKDFVVSCNNDGFLAFQNANKAYIEKAQYHQASKFYNQAIAKGIARADCRYQSYIRLASCLFKLNQLPEARRWFVEAWLLQPDLQLAFGDQATKVFCKKIKQVCRETYGK